MELSMSGSALRTFTRSITCLARVGSDLVLQAHPSKLALHTLNSSRSAYESVSFARDFFDHFQVSDPPPLPAAAAAGTPLQCSVLLKSVLAVLRTPAAALDRLAASLPSPDAPKLQLSLHCLNGVRKTYWIACSAEPEVQTLALDRNRFPSRLAIRPRDLARLLSNFQSSLHEITIIATEPSTGPPDADGDIFGKAVELRSYIDPIKDDIDTRLHTQLWIDPSEEFLEYVHAGDPVDVTFGVKELKAFLTFCEGCEVDILLFFEKAGEPILMVPRFGIDDASSSDFDATLVLATMLSSQLTDGQAAQQPSTSAQQAEQHRAANTPPSVPEDASNHTKIWSELSGSAAKMFEVNREQPAQKEGNASAGSLDGTGALPNPINAPQKQPAPNTAHDTMHPMQVDHMDEPPDVLSDNPTSQHHRSNWVGPDDDDDEEEDEELCVQTTPQYMD